MKRLLSPPAPAADLGLLVARVLIGVILIAHGGQKFFDQGLGTVANGFEEMGVPAPSAAAFFAAAVEFGGGVLLIVGALTPLIGVLVAVDMAGAYWFAHRDAGLFAAEGGWELVAVIGGLALTLATVGAGRFSVDGLATGGRSRRA